ncbi:MAG: MFS transporter [Chloroflexi bacterium]|nr:MFS transporter [Chloroflexota bacterium]
MASRAVSRPDAGPVPQDAGGSAPRRAAGTSVGLAPFASTSYRYLFVGTALTMTGSFMQQVAQGWLIYDLTDSPTWLGIVSFARGIPMLLLALPAGVVVDRFDRRYVLVVTQALTALIAVALAALIATELVEPWHVAMTALLSGGLFVLIIPARQALTPGTVERSLLSAAIALLSTGQNSGRVIGPALAGLLIAWFGVAASFGVQAIGFVLALICAAMLAPQPGAGLARRGSAAQNLVEGVRYVWGDPTVLALTSLQAIPAFLLMPYTQLLPIFARDILHTGPDGLGTLMTAMGVGAVLGSCCIVALPVRRQGLFLFTSLTAFGLLLALFAVSAWMPLSIGLMGLIGVAQAIYLATNNTLVQLATPDELRGRVMSVYMMAWGLMPLGALPQGILADWFGAPIVLAGAGLLGCVVILAMAVRSPALRGA